MPKESPYLNTAQTAFYLGISEKTLKLMRARGTGPPYQRHGRSVRYRIDKVNAWSDATGRSFIPPPEKDEQLTFDFIFASQNRDLEHDY